VTVVELGGPKNIAAQTCSALRVRRLVAGELSVDESAAAEEHLAACAKCRATRAEVEGEERALAEAVPFEAFAAGVAEKLAQEQEKDREPARERTRQLVKPTPRWARVLGSVVAIPLAAAMCLFMFKVATEEQPFRRAGSSTERSIGEPTDNLGALKRLNETRTKGGPAVSVFAVRAARTFALREGEPSQQGDRLLPSLEPAGHAFALVALVEPGEVSVLFKGPARAGPLPEAFEWTGSVTHARIAAVYADAPLDEAAVVAALRGGDAAAIAGAQVVFHALERRGAQQAPK
jgi:anti-sigma factor RsiW